MIFTSEIDGRSSQGSSLQSVMKTLLHERNSSRCVCVRIDRPGFSALPATRRPASKQTAVNGALNSLFVDGIQLLARRPQKGRRHEEDELLLFFLLEGPRRSCRCSRFHLAPRRREKNREPLFGCAAKDPLEHVLGVVTNDANGEQKILPDSGDEGSNITGLPK